MCQKKKEKNNKKSSLILVGIQFSILLLFVFFNKFNVTSFADRIMGNALANGVDISQKINTYYIILFALIPGIAIGISKMLEYIFEEKDIRTIKYMNIVAILGIISTILNFFDVLQKDQVTQICLTVLILLAINFIIIAVKMFSRIFKKEFNFENLKWAVISAIPLVFFEILVLHKFSTFVIEKNVWIVFYLISTIILYILVNLKKVNKPVLKKAYTFFVLAPLMEAIYLEVYNILNQHSLFIIHKLRYDIMIYLILGLIAIIYYIVNRKKNIKFYYTRYYYPIIIIALVAISVAVPMTTTVDTDFFETSNHATGVYELFTLGKIPIVENFDAHMMGNQIFGIIYGIFNGNAQEAMFCTYGVYRQIIFIILLYFLLANVFSRDVAFLTALFFPIENDVGLVGFNISILAILALLKAYKKQDIKSYLVYWLSLAFLCIWQLDIGYAISISTVVVLIYMLIKGKKEGKEIKLKNAIITFVGVIAVAGIGFISLCLIKNVNPIERLIEFLKLSMSNINWAYNTAGENTGLTFVVCYILLPLIVVGTLIYEAFYCKDSSNKIRIILLSLGLFYILNFQRAIVRHSIAEGTSIQVFSLGIIYIALYTATHFGKRDSRKFLIAYISLIIISGFVTGKTNIENKNTFETALNKYLTFEAQDTIYVEKQQRVKISEYMQNEIKNLKIVMDEILDEKETYMDLSNQTLLYTFLQKEKPVYVNQSPGLLSGEKTQQYFIDEVEAYENGVPVILKAKGKLLAENIDGIENDYRYYLVSEYAYQRYTPAATIDGYEIWIENSVFEEKMEKLKQIQNDHLKIITKEEYIESNQEEINLNQIARIWGEYDVKKDEHKNSQILAENIDANSIENKIVANLENVDKTQGNNLDLKIQSEKQTNLTINLYQNDKKICSFIVNVEEGEHNYRIRVSCLYEWFETNINNIGLSTNENIHINSMELCQVEKAEK